MDTTTIDALLANDPDFAAICDARRDAAIAHMEAATGLDIAAAYRAHARTVVAVCASIVGRGDAEDVAQVAWLKAHRARGSYSPEMGSIPTWLRSIARNVALDHLRHARRRPEDLDDRSDAHTAEALDVGAAIDTARRVASARAAMATLPAAQREAVTSLYLDGHDHHTAAAIAGCEPGAMRVRAHRGVAALRSALA
jgi:RNA polymerase sigma-70 factor (ECF subfamily)